MENALNAYCLELADSLNSFFEMRNQDYSHQGVHGFRITVKKLRGLVLLFDFLVNNPEIKIVLAPIHKIYKPSGELRDIFIQTKIVKKLKDECPVEVKKILRLFRKEERVAYLNFISAVEQLEQLEWHTMLCNYKNIIAEQARNVTLSDILELVRSEQVTITRLSLSNVGFKELHEIRRHLKVLIYTLELLARTNQLRIVKPRQIKGLNKLQDELGEMNDWVNLERKLRKLNHQNLMYPELEWIAGVQKNVIKSRIVSGLTEISNVKFSELFPKSF